MKWKVEGADAKTGKERSVVIEANDHAAAEQKAREHGLLISSVVDAGSQQPDSVPVIQYKSPDTQQADQGPILPPGVVTKEDFNRRRADGEVRANWLYGAGALAVVIGICCVFAWPFVLYESERSASIDRSLAAQDALAEGRHLHFDDQPEDLHGEQLRFGVECVVGGLLLCGVAACRDELHELRKLKK